MPLEHWLIGGHIVGERREGWGRRDDPNIDSAVLHQITNALHPAYDNRMTSNLGAPEVLLVVPTLGLRNDLLRLTLASIRSQSVPADIVMVTPSSSDSIRALADEYEVETLGDPGSLPLAINAGVQERRAQHTFVGWLNDDDLLEPNSLAATTAALRANQEAVVAYGACRYIDEHGRHLWLSRAGSWAPRIIGWGPDLIPQPGMLVRASAWRDVGGLDPSYRLAFDLDLLLRLRALGTFVNTHQVVSSFRWHPNSLTVEDRRTNLAESERAKRAALSPMARRCAWMWESPVRWATRIAVHRVNQRAQRLRAG